ncbi:sirohydrochlorin cobaltochelatase [Desulfogranum japonicum]|uniref:sirohydrochlorin cobaltochelatase n=1 Tax=Desulfogranum japonicum TaxID=231447 RepID=UPI0004185BC8|nr:sirohydrochlorin cobaltochelatase [Desulfogranum japonicum]
MHQRGYIGRKMRLPKLHKDPAIIIAAFGSTNKNRAVLEEFQRDLEVRFPSHSIYWGYTSEIIRKKLKLPSLQQTLAQVESDGFRKAVVQPIHIFPGTEYTQLAETCEFFPGMNVFLSETLLHRWDFIKELLEIVEPEFFTPEEGLNLIALHGTPLAADPVNIVYMGMDNLLTTLYPNVLAATVEGVPDHEAVLAKIKRDNLADKYKRVKIIPLMYYAGIHVDDDLMGEEDSWRAALEDMGFTVECPQVTIDGETRYKGLAHYPGVNKGFLDRLERTLELAEYY